MFKKEIEPELSFKNLKSKHPNIRLSVEKINQQILPFSEVLVKKKAGHLQFQCIGRKPV